MSVTVEPPGPNCPAGGQRISSAAGDSYVCNGFIPKVAHVLGADLPAGGFPTRTWLQVDFTGNPYPSDDLPGTDLANNRFIIPSAGLYDITAMADSCARSRHNFGLHLKANGATLAYIITPLTDECRVAMAREVVFLAQDDAITMEVFASENGPLFGIGNIRLTVLKLR